MRELRNLLERASLLCDGDVLETSHMQQALQVSVRKRDAEHVTNGSASRNDTSRKKTLKVAERDAFMKLVESHAGSRADLAKSLGISVRSLYRKLNSVE